MWEEIAIASIIFTTFWKSSLCPIFNSLELFISMTNVIGIVLYNLIDQKTAFAGSSSPSPLTHKYTWLYIICRPYCYLAYRFTTCMYMGCKRISPSPFLYTLYKSRHRLVGLGYPPPFRRQIWWNFLTMLPRNFYWSPLNWFFSQRTKITWPFIQYKFPTRHDFCLYFSVNTGSEGSYKMAGKPPYKVGMYENETKQCN